MFVTFVSVWILVVLIGRFYTGHFVTMLFDLTSACVAAVISRSVLHHCVVICFWSSGIMECTCMLLTCENGVPLMR